MIRIKRIQVQGFRSLDGGVSLAEKTVLRGGVGSGKSSVLDALRFAVLGYVPRLGKRPLDTARAMAGAEIRVRVQLDDGRWFERSLRRFKDELRSEVSASWTGTMGAGQTGPEIVSLFGETEEAAAEALDVRDLVDAAPMDRTRRVEALLAKAAPDPAVLVAKGGALAVLRLCGAEKLALPAEPAALRALATATAATLTPEARTVASDVWREVAPTLRDRGPVEAIEAAKAGKLKARESARKNREVAEGAGAIETAEDVEALRGERDHLIRADNDRRVAVVAHEQWAKREADFLACERARDAILETTDVDALVAEIRKIEGAEAPPPEVPFVCPRAVREEADVHDQRARAARNRASELTDALPPEPAEPQPESTPVPEVSSLREVAAKTRAVADAALASPWAEARELVAGLGTTLVSVKGRIFSPETEAAIFSRLEALGAFVVKQLGVDPVAARKVADQWEAEVITAEALVRSVAAANQKRREQWITALADHQVKRAEIIDALKTAETEGEAGVRLIEEARRRHDAEQAAANAAWHQRATARAREVRDLREKRDLINALCARADEARNRRTPEPAVGPDVSAQLAATDRRYSTALQAAGRATAVERARAAAADAEQQEKAYAAVEWALAKIRDEAVADRSAPLVAALAEILGPAFPAGEAPAPYLRGGKGGPDFGWSRGGRDVPLATLSGGETALYMAALAAAVVRLRAPAVPLLLVEGAEIGAGETAAAVLRALGGLAGVQVIFASVVAPERPEAPWGVCTMQAGHVEPVAVVG